MLIEALPNDKLKTIAAKFDNGDKKLDEKEQSVFMEEASKALKKGEISQEDFNKINPAAVSKDDIQKQSAQKRAFEELSNQDIHQKILDNTKKIEIYKQHLEENNVDYSFYCKDINSNSSRLNDLVILGSALMALSGAIISLVGEKNIKTPSLGCLGTVMFGIGLAAGIYQKIKGSKAEKSEETRTNILNYYRAQMEKLEKENKELEKELANRIDYT